MVFQKLGGKAVLDYVLENARAAVPPDQIYVVMGPGQNQAWNAPGEYQYILQQEPLGTGHAVLQAAAAMRGFDGDLLILYGDTPLFRTASIRGLLNRHRLRKAHLTLLTAVTAGRCPTGASFATQAGRIIDIIEEAEAAERCARIRELNVGAYVVDAPAIFRALERFAVSNGWRLPPDGLRARIDPLGSARRELPDLRSRTKCRASTTPEDLAQAELILRKRLYRPRRRRNRTCHASAPAAGARLSAKASPCTTCAGSARRWPTRSRAAARRSAASWSATTAASFRGRPPKPPPKFSPATTSRPCCCRRRAHAAGHLRHRAFMGRPMAWCFTASHNPPEWNGLKVFTATAHCCSTTKRARSKPRPTRSPPSDVIKLELDLALEAGIVERRDFTNEYVDAVEAADRSGGHSQGRR